MLVSAAAADDAVEIARVYVETWRDAYRTILPEDTLAHLSVPRIAHSFVESMHNGEIVLVAKHDGRVIGFASGGRESDRDVFFRSEIFTLYVAPFAQRVGVGRALVDEMRARLPAPIIVWVLAQNRAGRAFYESVGASSVRKSVRNVGGVPFSVRGYAWFDVDGAG
jgi:ribosomal protein S18 acetylase RimI-like enzyme